MHSDVTFSTVCTCIWLRSTTAPAPPWNYAAEDRGHFLLQVGHLGNATIGWTPECRMSLRSFLPLRGKGRKRRALARREDPIKTLHMKPQQVLRNPPHSVIDRKETVRPSQAQSAGQISWFHILQEALYVLKTLDGEHAWWWWDCDFIQLCLQIYYHSCSQCNSLDNLGNQLARCSHQVITGDLFCIPSFETWYWGMFNSLKGKSYNWDKSHN